MSNSSFLIADYSFSLGCKKCSIKDSYQMFCIASRCQQSLIFSVTAHHSPDTILRFLDTLASSLNLAQPNMT